MNNSQIDRDIYDVTTYSDKELLDILDLINPTDRELEAKLIHYIRKYDHINSPSAKLLSKFYHDIYYHFFDIEGFEEKEEEGFENNDIIVEGFEEKEKENPNILSKGKISSNDISFSTPSTPSNGNQIQLTSNLDYTKGKLNPLLKQTYKRTICIDSQYRDSTQTLSTDFTLNFTETLKDVVSLKLYAVQIPYTWYTISRNYGSNFIYLKGNSPGIDNGYHDFRIKISPGNYQIDTIGAAIQSSIQQLSNLYTDVSFGSTSLIYNKTACTATFQLDIQKAYNETNYHFYFNDLFYSPVPANTSNSYRTSHLSTFLGFNYPDYSCSSIYSSRNIPFLNSNDSLYSMDTSNNTIYLIQYAPTINKDGSIADYNLNSYIYQSIPIQFSVTNGLQSQSSILSIVQNQINSLQQKSNNLITQCSVEFININNTDVNGNTIDNNGNNYFKWSFKLNRFAGSNYPGSKLCIVLPSIENNTTNPVWIGSNSCFQFKSIYNELNHLISETYVSTSSFNITGNIYFEFVCNDPLYNVNEINNISSGIIPNNNAYSLNQYISEIDKRFDIMNLNLLSDNITNVFIRNNSFAEINSTDFIFNMQIDMARIFYTSNFRINISGAFVNVLRFSATNINTNIGLSDGITFTSTFQQLSTYFISENNALIMTIYPDGKFGGGNSISHGISNDVSYNIYLPVGITYSGFYELQNGINNIFRSYSDSIDSILYFILPFPLHLLQIIN